LGLDDILIDATTGALGAGLVSKANKIYRIAKLRKIAETRGLENMGRKGYVETWEHVTDPFERLNIKLEAAKSANVQAGSKVPRFDYRIDAGKYWDPFTSKVGPGPKSPLGHVPLEPEIPGVSSAVGGGAGALTPTGDCGCQ